ncbi:MAG: deoxyribonuclease IV [Deltaproteobacteria bacterium]|nr:deoxyribonuclease IV [Deltaproteobacteria bacterium]
MLLGAHESIAGGFDKALERGIEDGCEGIQIFTKSNNQWKSKPIAREEAEQFQEAFKKSKFSYLMTHDSYLINLGASDPDAYSKSRAAFADELQRCDQLGIPYLVMHPGSHLGEGEAKAIERIAGAITEIFDSTEVASVTVLIESAAGQGSNVGYRFEHLSDLIERIEPKKQIGVCMDTCHVFAAGYDFRTKQGYEKMIEEFDRIVGVPWIKAFHVNDSKKDLGSRVDRHEQIGEGFIGSEPFRFFLQDRRFKDTPAVLETPPDKEPGNKPGKKPDKKEDRAYKKNLQRLRDLL